MERCPYCFKPLPENGKCDCHYTESENSRIVEALEPGTVLGACYQIGAVLGKGGFGITYKGFDLNLEKEVAIKEFYPSGMVARASIISQFGEISGPNASRVIPLNSKDADVYNKSLDMFFKEARVLAKLSKLSNVVHIYQIFRENNTAYFVMDYVRGKSLSRVMRERGAGGGFPEEELISLLDPVLGALEKVHAQGILHRDIAPDNIVIDEDGNPVLLDFGAAKVEKTAADGSEVEASTMSSVVVEKKGFTPIEQIGGHATVRSDIYALGATYYYLLTGKIPPESYMRAAKDNTVPLTEYGVSQPVSDAVMKAFAFREQERWQNVADFRSALKAALQPAEPPTPPTPPIPPDVPPIPPTPPTPPRNRLLFLLIPLLLLIGAGAAFLLLRNNRPAPAPVQTDTRPVLPGPEIAASETAAADVLLTQTAEALDALQRQTDQAAATQLALIREKAARTAAAAEEMTQTADALSVLEGFERETAQAAVETAAAAEHMTQTADALATMEARQTQTEQAAQTAAAEQMTKTADALGTLDAQQTQTEQAAQTAAAEQMTQTADAMAALEAQQRQTEQAAQTAAAAEQMTQTADAMALVEEQQRHTEQAAQTAAAAEHMTQTADAMALLEEQQRQTEQAAQTAAAAEQMTQTADAQLRQTEQSLTETAAAPTVTPTPSPSPVPSLTPSPTPAPDEAEPVPGTAPEVPAVYPAGHVWSPLTDPEILPGYIVRLGSYDGSTVSWIVLDAMADGKLLLLSEKVLDTAAYNPVNSMYTEWESSGLRKQLNGEFLDAVFPASSPYRGILSPLRLENGGSYDAAGRAGYVTSSTEDTIFLLSVPEMLRYRDILAEAGDSADGYWLRSQGVDRTRGVYTSLSSDGRLSFIDNSEVAKVRGIRPAAVISASGLKALYQEGCSLLRAGDYAGAADRLSGLEHWKDILDALYAEHRGESIDSPVMRFLLEYEDENTCAEIRTIALFTDTLQNAQVGDTMRFGIGYDQSVKTGSKFKGPAPEWILLEKDAEKALFVMKDVMLLQRSRTTGERNWSKSSLRTYLNGTFYKTGFDEITRDAILTTHLYNGADVPETDDRIFVLSAEEAFSYLSDADLTAVLNGKPDAGAVSWWLRFYDEVPVKNTYAPLINSGGRISFASSNKTNVAGGRPALWLDLDPFDSEPDPVPVMGNRSMTLADRLAETEGDWFLPTSTPEMAGADLPFGAPEVISITQESGGDLTVRWTAVGGVSEYALYYSTKESFKPAFQLGKTRENSLTVSVPGGAGAERFFRVSAAPKDGSGSLFSETVSFTLGSDPYTQTYREAPTSVPPTLTPTPTVVIPTATPSPTAVLPTLTPSPTPTSAPAQPAETVPAPAQSETVERSEDPSGVLWDPYTDSKIRTGNILKFGRWNGEPIRWTVLDISDSGRMLLFSEQILDERAYHSVNSSYTTWEGSDLRAWLNGPFLDEAFPESSPERAALLDSRLGNGAAYDKDGKPGIVTPATTDQVFLLGVPDLLKYGAEITGVSADAPFWLRSQGADQTRGVYPEYSERTGLTFNGTREVARTNGIRPAVNVDVSVLEAFYAGVRGSIREGNYDAASEALAGVGCRDDILEAVFRENRTERLDTPVMRFLRENADADLAALIEENALFTDRIPDMNIGETVRFGSSIEPGYNPMLLKFEGEAPEWILLQKDADKALLVMKDLLILKQYRYTSQKGWADSLLNSFLNREYYTKGFDELIRGAILPAQLYNGENEARSESHIFILSANEALTYLPGDALSAGLLTDREQKQYPWWLRVAENETYDETKAPYMAANGTVSYDKANREKICAVRPALWLNLHPYGGAPEQMPVMDLSSIARPEAARPAAEETAVPERVQLAAPVITGIVQPDTEGHLTVSWTAVEGASKYSLYYSTRENFLPMIRLAETTDNFVTVTVPGDPGDTVYFKVRASQTDGSAGPYSETAAFTLGAEPYGSDSAEPGAVPVILSASVDETRRLTLLWTELEEADRYTAYYSTAADPDNWQAFGNSVSGELTRKIADRFIGETLLFTVRAWKGTEQGEPAEPYRIRVNAGETGEAVTASEDLVTRVSYSTTGFTAAEDVLLWGSPVFSYNSSGAPNSIGILAKGKYAVRTESGNSRWVHIRTDYGQTAWVFDTFLNYQRSAGQVPFDSLRVGDIFEYGYYEQDGNLNNGKEAVEWQVLAEEDGRLLVISRSALEAKPYHESAVNVTWETSTLREWLNGEFLTGTFSEAEQERIASVTHGSAANPDSGLSGGNDVEDRIFIPDLAEAEQYLSDRDRTGVPTAFARTNGVYRRNTNGLASWWLRTPGAAGNTAAYIDDWGSFQKYGKYVNEKNVAVRPAFWLLTAEVVGASQTAETGTAEGADRMLMKVLGTAGTAAAREDILLRSSASPGGVALITIRKDSPVSLTGEASGQWLKVTAADGSAGWVKSSSLSIDYETAQVSPSELAAGDRILFGHYEQDADMENGPEPVEWLVLGTEDGSLLLLSRYALDAVTYNDSTSSGTTWENCSLRAWLNGAFYDAAFSDAEKSRIIRSALTNVDNPSSGASGGNDTEDFVFLLSPEEADGFFPENTDRLCSASPFAAENGAYVHGETGMSPWWLRGPGSDSSFAAYVNHGGSVSTRGNYVGYDYAFVLSGSGTKIAVRPAVRLEIREDASGAEAGSEAGTGALLSVRAEKIVTNTVVRTDFLLRNAPSNNADVMLAVRTGQDLSYSGENQNGWLKVTTAAGVTGWITESAVQLVEEQSDIPVTEVSAGDKVWFGQYEQDAAAGPDPIEWQVLDVQNGRALLLSRFALDNQPYNTELTDVTWESSSLRAWLNGTFLNEAFRLEEQMLIPEVTVSADKNPDFDTDPGNNTSDRVFLLSINEAERYFSSDAERQAAPTKYAESHGARAFSDGNCQWWLRSPGNDQILAARVNNDGPVNDYGHDVSNSYGAVRPALWLDLSGTLHQSAELAVTDKAVTIEPVCEPMAEGGQSEDTAGGEGVIEEGSVEEIPENGAGSEPLYMVETGVGQKVVQRDFLLRTAPSDTADVMLAVRAGQNLSYSGETQNGWLKVTTEAGVTGWIAETAVQKGRSDIPASEVVVGNVIWFGRYEQDGTPGADPIEWQVLDVQDGRALLLSRYALDSQPYNTERTDVTWEGSSLRTWLNGTFLNEAFSVEEQVLIPEVNVSADKNPNYSADPGNSTSDKIFLLSISEAERYFANNKARQAQASEYAIKQGGYTSYSGNTWWWLRSPGSFQSNAARVSPDGSVLYGGRLVYYSSGAVRPALWIDL